MLARFLRLLLEAVQDINRRREFRNVDHTEGAVGVPDPYLLYPWTNGRHGLPIVRLIAHLHPIQLKAGLTAGRDWERSQVV